MEKKYMREALNEAKKAYLLDEVPVGAVIVKNNKIIARAHNEKENKQDPTKHAEIIAISRACKTLKSWRLDECIMYVTLEPCMMCAGALVQSRMKKIVYAVSNEKFGGGERLWQLLNNKNNNHFVLIEHGLEEVAARTLLQDFFKNKREH